MFGRLILFIVLVPLIELVLLHQVLTNAGLLATVAVVFSTGIIGVNLARRQGSTAWKAVQQQMSAGQTPTKEILNGVMILFAGAFLITPGIVTDVVGFSLLVPQLRLWLGGKMTAWFLSKAIVTVQNRVVRPGADDVDDFDGERASVRVVDPAENKA